MGIWMVGIWFCGSDCRSRIERLGDWGLLLGGTWHPLAREGLIARWARSTPIEARATERRVAAERLAERL